MKQIITMFILLPLGLFAQDTTRHTVLTGISFSNDLTYRLSKADSDLGDFRNEFDSLESARYGYSVGLNAGYWFRPGHALQGGLQYSRLAFGIDTLEIAELERIRFVYNYLEIPFQYVSVFRMQRKIQPIVSIGLQAGYLISHRETYHKQGEARTYTKGGTENLSRLNLSVLASAGFQKNIQQKYVFRLEAKYRQSITPLANSPMKRFLFSTGLQISLARNF